jgi:hypothetical protein
VDWGVGPGGRGQFAQALLTSAYAALVALGPVRIVSGHRHFQGDQQIARCVIGAADAGARAAAVHNTNFTPKPLVAAVSADSARVDLGAHRS